MNFLDLGDPANGTPPFTLPGRQVSGNIVRVINNSSSQLQFFFPGNTLQIRVPSRSIRRIQLTNPEQRQVTWQRISSDPTFIGTSDTVIEVYAPTECDHPFEQATAIGGGGAVNSLAGDFGNTYHWDTFATPLDPGYGVFGYPLFDVICPATGLYLLLITLVVLDQNTGTGGDRIDLMGTVGNSFAGGQPPQGQFIVSGGATFAYLPNGLTTFNGSFSGSSYYCMPYFIGQVKGEEILFGLSMSRANSGTYVNPPIVQAYAAVTLLAAA